mgnify:CR=1 FL=1
MLAHTTRCNIQKDIMSFAEIAQLVERFPEEE